jgi:hypothetical protein
MLIPPQFPLLPFFLPSLAFSPGNNVFEDAMQRVLGKFSAVMQAMSLHLVGLLHSNEPRHLLAPLYARPILALASLGEMRTHVPPSVIQLGPPIIARPRGTAELVTVPLPSCVPSVAPLRLRRHRLMYAAFGTLVQVPQVISHHPLRQLLV